MRKKKKRKYNKKENQVFHFQNRCIQRLGKLIDRKELIRRIQDNELELIRRDSNRVTVWKYMFEDKPYTVVYDKLRKQVVTIYEFKEQKNTPP